MPKVRITVALDEGVLRAVKVKAARTGKRDSQLIEESLRRDLGLDEADKIWAKVRPAAEGEGRQLATGELRAMRKSRPGEGGA